VDLLIRMKYPTKNRSSDKLYKNYNPQFIDLLLI